MKVLGFISALCLLFPAVTAAKVGFGDMVIKKSETVWFVVSFGGDIRVDGDVDRSVMSFGGDIIVSGGGKVGKNAVSLTGDIIVETDGVVDNRVVSLGGDIIVAPGGKVKGEHSTRRSWRYFMPTRIFNRDFSGMFSSLFGGPLFGSPQKAVAVAFFILRVVFWIVLAVITTMLFPGTVHRLSRVAEFDLPHAILAGFLCMVMIPFTLFALIITIAGIPLIPFAFLALFLVYYIGSVGIAIWIGRVIPEAATRSMTANAVLGVIIINAVKLIPVGGLLVSILLSSSAFGVVFITLFSRRLGRDYTATFI